MKYIVFAILFISILSYGIAQPTINSATLTRIEGGFAVVEYQISGTSITGAGVQWDTTAISDTTNQWKTKHLSPSAGTYTDTIIEADTIREGKYHYRVYAYDGDGIAFSDDEGFNTQPKLEPDIVPSFNLTATDSSKISGSWGTHSAFGYILKYVEGTSEPTISELQDTTSPAPPYKALGTNDPNKELDHSTGTSWTVSEFLKTNTTYAVKIIPYDNTGILDANQNYRQDPNSWATITTLKGYPSTQASNITFSDVTSTSFKVSWTNGNGDQRAVYLNEEDSFTDPTDDVLPTADASWNDGGAQCVYVGAGSEVTVTGISDTATYYAKVFEFNNPGELEYYCEQTGTNNPDSLLAPVAYWKGVTSDSWTTGSNWSRDQAPVTSQDIRVPGGASNYPSIQDITANNVTIEPGGLISVENTYTFTINGNLTIESDDSNYGALLNIRNASTSVSGTSKYIRYIGDQDYHLISNPTDNSAITVLTGYFADEYDEANNQWSPLNSNSSLNIMQGYSVKNSYSDQYDTLTFSTTGSFNDGTQSITVYNSDPDDVDQNNGWNLVGNPYPSTIDWEASTGWTRDGIDYTMQTFNGSSYLSYNYNLGSGTGSRYIPPCQGFFIYVSAGGNTSETLAVTNAVRVSNEDTYFKEQNQDSTRVITKLKLQNSTNENSIVVVAFMPDATPSYDMYDGYKLFSDSVSAELYSISAGDNLSINTLNYYNLVDYSSPTKVDLGIKAQSSSELSLSIYEQLNVPDSIDILIADNYNYDTVSIKENPYTFYCTSGTHNDMLDLLFVKKQDDVGTIGVEQNIINAYITHNQLIINQTNPQQNSNIIVSDVMGKVIFNKTLTTVNQIHFPIPAKTNIFVVKIYTEREVLYQKTFFNRE